MKSVHGQVKGTSILPESSECSALGSALIQRPWHVLFNLLGSDSPARQIPSYDHKHFWQIGTRRTQSRD